MIGKHSFMPSPTAVAAILVTYNPDTDFAHRLDALLAQITRVVIVDNGSRESCLSSLEPYLTRDSRVTIFRNKTNLGIATALNQGVGQLIEEGYRWALTLDQDSFPAGGMVSALCDRLAADPDSSRVAMVGTNRRDPANPGAEHRWVRPKQHFPFFERVGCGFLDARGTTAVITSGTLTNLQVFQEIGPFRDQLFIDLVDTEYCLRARRAGYRIIVACGANLIHRIGEKRTVSILGMGIVATHHAPVRRYYLFRNTVALMREYFRVCPHWIIYHALALGQILLGIVLLENRKFAALRACFLGIYDGVRGKTGPADSEF